MIETGLKDKVVIVTGAAAGIGRATAERFVAEGCRVAAWDVNEAPESAGVFQKVNVADAGEVEAAVADVVDRWGPVSVLVNNAGIVRDAQLIKYKEGEVVEDDRRGLGRGDRRQPQGRLQLHPRRGAAHDCGGNGGAILNASSVACLNGNFGQTNYVATKAGVIGMTKTWARELGRFGIRVNAVAPGFVKTEIINAMPEKVIQAMVAHTPMGRIGDTKDIAEAYVWLASDAAAWVTGTTLSVDGGLVIGT